MSPIFKEEPVVTVPSPGTRLWRYLTIEKLSYLVRSQALYFCRVDLYEDWFEGSLTKPATNLTNHVRKAEAGLPDNLSSQLGIRQQMRRFFYANCWHMNRKESLAMWNRYLPKRDGVAIQTTHGELAKAIPVPPQGALHAGCVMYLDYDNDMLDFLGPLLPFFCKRHEYEHEKEFRFLYHFIPDVVYSRRARSVLAAAAEVGGAVRVHPSEMNFNVPTPEGYSVFVNPNKFVKTMTLAPNAPAAMIGAVESLCANHLPGVTLRRSRLKRWSLFHRRSPINRCR